MQVAENKESEAAEPGSPAPQDGIPDLVMNLIRQHSGPRGVSILELTGFAEKSGISEPLLIETIRGLITDDEIYQPSSGFVKIL